MNRIRKFLKWLFGPTKTPQQTLRELIQNMTKEEYDNTLNVQGQKLPVEHLRLVVKKDE